MAHNRYEWSALCVIRLTVFLQPRSQAGSAVDAIVFLGLLTVLLYGKVTYFAAGLLSTRLALRQ
jgi:hypothetical protein